MTIPRNFHPVDLPKVDELLLHAERLGSSNLRDLHDQELPDEHTLSRVRAVAHPPATASEGPVVWLLTEPLGGFTGSGAADLARDVDKAYRDPDVYQVSREITGAVSQVQKTADKALRGITDYVKRHTEPDGTPTDIEFSTVRPKQVVVAGSLSQITVDGVINREQLASFEMYRRAMSDVEIITFDELYERARFIVEDA